MRCGGILPESEPGQPDIGVFAPGLDPDRAGPALPLAGLVGAFTYGLVHFIGGYPGAILGFALLWLTATAIWLRSRRAPIDHTNVNADWEGNLTAGLEAGAQPLADQRPPVPAPPAPTPPPNHRAPQFGVTTRNAP